MQALQAEGLKKELQEAQAAAAEVQADLSAQLHSQHMLTEDVKQQCVAARHELTPLQVKSRGDFVESDDCNGFYCDAGFGQEGRSNWLSSAGSLSFCCVAGGACC